ncbi:MAG TPA: UDP-3-O-acyl-N-acetylglucosamine deacetylase [Beijerinckiaceae bacterium]|jgi:UDP-3-O-[3-hydroxymyristoyl] N-acetylglucosamine deacetylase
MKSAKQTTLRQRATLSGAGVHSNAPVQIVLHPAEADSGVVFLRTGLDGGRERAIEARWSQVSMTELCTVIGDASSGAVSTIEHLLAALAGLGVDNVMVEIDGPEVPIMDGSAAHFVEAIDLAGVVELSKPRRYVKVLKPVRVEHGRAFSELRPAASGFRLEVEIDFTQGVIGRQKKVIDLDPKTFRREIARARTFGFVQDVERLWKAGFALGASLDNSVALEEGRVLNPEGLRFRDEFVRHKTLDAVGDLALAGAPLIGAYRSYCGGHRTNVAVLEALFSDRDAYEIVEAPTRRLGGRVDLGFAAQPAFAPELN